MSNPPSSFAFQVDEAQAGIRLDALIAACTDHCSRSQAAGLIRRGCVTVDGRLRKPSYPVKPGERISGTIPQAQSPDFHPEAIPLEILYEDAEVVVVNKQPSMVVHPAPGHGSGTLVNALMYHCPDLIGISGSLRPGVVHRLDKDTSGALVVAKTSRAMLHLAAQFKAREIRKDYLALVYGIPEAPSGTIDRPIGRHPVERKKMATVTRHPRPALTHWRIKERFAGACLLALDIRTGRTHQIRVHCQALGHALIGDPVYGRRGERRRLAEVSAAMAQAVAAVDRQMLHAWRLAFDHPATGERLTIEAPLPTDMAELIRRFREIAGGGYSFSE